jgi:signal transduction histidine kinase
MGDENLLRRVLVNLIDNAIKFSSEKGSISLTVEEKGDAIVRIANVGKELSSEQIDTLFNRFVQTEDGRRHSNSNGLGLFFCQQIINAHGGKISCRSDATATEFLFTLPKAISDPSDATLQNIALPS